jgi:DNA invertase Pin-like site-specific DNA recombinase
VNRPKKAALQYRKLSAVIRVSRRNGREGESFMSPELQRESIERWAEANGVTIVSWWDETDSVSAKTLDRVGLKGAMDEAFSGKSDGIIVAKVNRFSRQMSAGLKALRKLTLAGKAFVAVDDGIDGKDPSSFGNKMVLAIYLLMAEWQLDTLTDQWEDVRWRHIGAGISNYEPYGYRKGKDKRLVPHRAEAKLVRLVFTKRAAGDSLRCIATAVNEDGYRTRSGSLWTASALSDMLRNRVYLGELWSGRERGLTALYDEDGNELEPLEPVVNVAAHKAIITRKLWDRIVRQDDVRGPASEFPLTGILRCASCGGRMKGNTDTWRPGTHGVRVEKKVRSYRCRRDYNWGTCPSPARVQADEVEALVIGRFVTDYVQGSRFRSDSTVDEGALAEAITERDETQSAVRAWTTNPATVKLMRLDPDGWQATLTEMTDAYEAALVKVRELQMQAVGVDLPTDLAELWGTDLLSPTSKRELLAVATPVVAVWPLLRRVGIPIEDRVRIFEHDDPDLPTNLPTRGREHVGMVAIAWQGGEHVAGEQASEVVL